MKSMYQSVMIAMLFFVLIIGPVGCSLINSNQVSETSIPSNASLKEIMKLFGEKYSNEKCLTKEDKELFTIAYEKSMTLIEEQGFADYKLEDLNAMKANHSSLPKFSDVMNVQNISVQREQAEDIVLMMFEDEKSSQLKDIFAGDTGDKIISDGEDITKMMLLDEKSNDLKSMTAGGISGLLLLIIIICVILIIATPIIIIH